ncbi:MAG: hypothetical protein ACJ8CN_03010 [Gemmatimonadales bacterium]
MRSSVMVLGLSLLRAAGLAAQTEAETQRATLTGLRSFGVHASVQLSQGATLGRIEEKVLRDRIGDALRREGIVIQTRSDVRDGSQASPDLLYVVMQTKDTAGHALGFAASSCLQASQMVRIPRLTTPKHIAYAVVSTWRSCGLLVGDSASFGRTLLQNADQQLARFVEAWRRVNLPPPAPASPVSPETRVSMELSLDR